MREHNNEKFALEDAASDIFISIYNLNNTNQISIFKRQERPDVVLIDSGLNKHGLEITHLFYDKVEAKMIFGRLDASFHGTEVFDDLLTTLNNLIKKKEKSIQNYQKEFPVALLIRNASPIFGMSDFLPLKSEIYQTKGISNVWFLSRDGSSNEWLLKDLLSEAAPIRILPQCS